ncbi:MAG: VTT domain-containing protein [Planctomycetota bacterium]
MFDQLVQAISDYPYIGVAMVFLLCGLGFPLPEELVLLAGGYICFKYPERASLLPMMAWCGGAIMLGDLIPFTLGRVFGVRLLRLRWLRYFITKQRLATFDRWFRRRGDWVIVISRFLAGLRVVAFFTAGAMKMRWLRFLMLDGTGITLMVPLLVWAGFSSAEFIDEMIATVQKVERGLLWGVGGAAVVLALGVWWYRRRRQLQKRRAPGETFVQPQLPVVEPPDSSADGPTGPSAEHGDEAGGAPSPAQAPPTDAPPGDDAEPSSTPGETPPAS